MKKRYLLLILFVLIVAVGGSGSDDTNDATGNVINENGIQNSEISDDASDSLNENDNEYLDITLDDLMYDYVCSTSTMTDLQKEESFKSIKGKYIKDEAIVTDIDISLGYPVVKILHPENEFLNGATIYFKKSEKDKLLEVEKYASLTFEGVVSDYNSLLGIIIKDAVFVGVA